MGLFIAGLRAIQLMLRGVQISQREVWNVVFGIKLFQLEEILLCRSWIMQVAREISKRGERRVIVWIRLQRMFVSLKRLSVAIRSPQQVRVVQLDVYVV